MSSGLLTDHPRADPRPALQSQPLFELRCSNNAMHVHSCADSCALLINLLQYLTSAGDLHPPPRPPSPTEIAGQKVQVRPGPTAPGAPPRPRPCRGPHQGPGACPSLLTRAHQCPPARPSSQRAPPPCPRARRWRRPSSTSGT